MVEEMRACLIQNGYQRISTNAAKVELYLLPEKEKAYMVILFLDQDGDCFSGQQYDTILHQIRDRLLQQGYLQVEQLSIIATNHTEKIRENYQAQEHYWIAVLPENRLIIYENQDFGTKGEILRKAIEKSLQPVNHQVQYNQSVKWDLSNLPLCTILLAVINCIVFLLVEASGSSHDTAHMLKWGAMSETLVMEQKEYFRFLTSMFLHFGIYHLVNNMFILIFVGKMAEQILGKVKYIFIYFATGIIAGVVSMVYNMMQNRFVVSAGASGAIFGIVGAMVLIFLRNRGKQREVSTRQILLFAAVSFYAGIYGGEGVDVAAHVGGFLSGILLAALIYRKPIYTAGGENSES